MVYLKYRLEEAEIRFQSRESRPEDMDMLDTLKRALADRELEMRKLVVRKTGILCKVDRGSDRGKKLTKLCYAFYRRKNDTSRWNC